jgi:hypothetical protein
MHANHLLMPVAAMVVKLSIVAAVVVPATFDATA